MIATKSFLTHVEHVMEFGCYLRSALMAVRKFIVSFDRIMKYKIYCW